MTFAAGALAGVAGLGKISTSSTVRESSASPSMTRDMSCIRVRCLTSGTVSFAFIRAVAP